MIEISPVDWSIKVDRYDEAWLYCACLVKDGYSDWRLPTIQEYRDFKEITISAWWDSNTRQDFMTVQPVRTNV